jgi:preprotein translocase subunit YajC
VQKLIPLVILIVIFIGMVAFTRRNRQRAAAADQARRQQLGPGSEVMTTSGLYATVVEMNPDDTALLSIAPGVEVRWAIAALRTPAELPQRYRAPLADAEPAAAEQPNGGSGTGTQPAEPEHG